MIEHVYDLAALVKGLEETATCMNETNNRLANMLRLGEEQRAAIRRAHEHLERAHKYTLQTRARLDDVHINYMSAGFALYHAEKFHKEALEILNRKVA